MTDLVFSGVTKRFGTVSAVTDFDLRVESGESVVLLGPSGCGKTTLLRMVAGFETPTEGDISIGGQVVSGAERFVPPEQRQLGMVFQSYALWPHMSVAANVAFGLTTRGQRRRRKRSKVEIVEAVESALARVQLPGFGDRYPHEISGGQQQRVALARALVVDPKVLLLDEPLSNLDTLLREEMRHEIRRIQQESGITMVYITHDRSEGLGIADRIVSLRLGRVQQIGTPAELYRHPVSRFVAEALGPVDVLPAVWRGASGVELPTGQVVVAGGLGAATHRAAGGEVAVSVRPHDILLEPVDKGGHGEVAQAVFSGDEIDYLVRIDGVPDLVRVLARAPVPLPVGQPVRVRVTAAEVNVLSSEVPSVVAEKAPLEVG